MAPPGRLRWLCRRGMRELDVLLSGFLAQRYPDLDDALKADFAEFLELQDPEIWAYLLGRAEPEPALAAIVSQIRDFSAR
ncbi:MAG: succinate dehydrogenase assembly factor 2 [Gammaproteobacteria bacterium]|jgi:antitoxin CptB|nr:succinate dehydrogenase assembly factor 2 [Gammaproteobacteria bacterium]